MQRHELVLTYMKYITVIGLIAGFFTITAYITPQNQERRYEEHVRYGNLVASVERMSSRCECFEPVFLDTDVCAEEP